MSWMRLCVAGLHAGLLQSPCLTAQQPPPSPAPAVAASAPIVRLECRGPAGMRELLLPTNVGAMLASEEGTVLWRGLAAQLEAHWRELNGEPATFAVARARLLDYAGRIRGQMWLSAGSNHDGGESIVLVGESDGHTELPRLAADLRGLLAAGLGARWVEPGAEAKSEGGLALPMAQVGGDLLVLGCAPDGRLVFASGPDSASVQRATGAGLALPVEGGRPRPGDAAFSVSLDLAQLVQRESSNPTSARVLAALGCGSLRTLELRLSPNGPHVQLDLMLAAEGDRGLFAGLFPEVAGSSDLARLVPEDSLGFKTGLCDPLRLWRSCLAAIAEATDKKIGDLEAEAKQEAGIDVAKDLLAHLTGEHLLVWQPPGGDPDAAPAGEQAELDVRWAFAAKLADGKAFAAAFQTMLAKAGLEPKEEHGVLRAGEQRNWFMPTYRFGVAGDLCVLVIGDDPDDRLDRILLRAKEPAPPRLDPRLRVLPPGCNGFGAASVDLFLRYHLALVDEGLGGVVDGLPGFEPRVLAKQLAEHRGLLQRHQLGSVSAFTGTKLGRWTFRLLW